MDSQTALIQQAISDIETFQLNTPTATIVDNYRLLRNSVASDEKYAKFIFAGCDFENKLLKKTTKLINDFSENSDDEIYVNFRRCALQFMGNFSARITEAKSMIFFEFRPIFAVLLRNKDAKLRNYSTFLFFNCLNSETMAEFSSETNIVEFSNSQNILTELFESFKHETDSSEWSLFILERFLTNCENFTKIFWNVLLMENRILIIEICISLLNANAADKDKPITHFINVSNLIEPYVEICSGIAIENQEFNENLFAVQMNIFGPLLDLFCKATDASLPNYESIRCNSELLRSTVGLLKRIQIMCRSGHPFFAVGKIDDRSAVSHPCANIKRGLINLIANLCYHLPVQQTLAGQLDAVSLIMDCTEMDGKNQFITQWAIFGLRNLLENCQENQLIVTELIPQGIVANYNSQYFTGSNLDPYIDDNGQLKFCRK